jgi:Transcriptional regulator, AbiEi antitoxin
MPVLALTLKAWKLVRAALMEALAEADNGRVDHSSIASMTKSDAIIAVLKNAMRPMRIKEIVDALHQAGRPDEQSMTINIYLSDLTRSGRIVRTQRGVYAFPTAGTARWRRRRLSGQSHKLATRTEGANISPG